MATDSPLPERIGGYRLLAPIREGSVSSVYRAAAPSTGREVAIKLFTPDVVGNAAAVARFERSVAAAAQAAHHPNLLEVMGSGRDGDRLYVITELFLGMPLERLLTGGRLAPEQAISIAKRICRGLAHAHARGLVHGHLSPRVILVSSDLSQVKVADFGLSEAAALSELEGTMQTTGALNLQALHYLAPEQTSGHRAEPTPRTDLYATGAMLQEMLTGRPAGQRVALPSHVNPEVPPAADLVVLRCLARDPGGRYASAAELQTDLEKLEETLQVRMLPNLRVDGKSSHTWLIAGVAVLVIVAAVLFFVLR